MDNRLVGFWVLLAWLTTQRQRFMGYTMIYNNSSDSVCNRLATVRTLQTLSEFQPQIRMSTVASIPIVRKIVHIMRENEEFHLHHVLREGKYSVSQPVAIFVSTRSLSFSYPPLLFFILFLFWHIFEPLCAKKKKVSLIIGSQLDRNL